MQNVNPDEIEKFSKLAKEWWDEKGPMKPLHQLNPLQLSYVEKFVSLHHKHVLDIGCGGGILTESLAKAGAHATGIDMSTDAIAIAKTHAEENQIKVRYEKIRTEDFANNHLATFDVITCMEMLEHVPEPTAIIEAASHMLKPNGKIFFSTLNRTMKSFLTAIVGAEYILNILPKGTHHYETFIKPSELSNWAKEYDLRLVDLQGIQYKICSNAFEFCNTVDVNYLICFEKNR